MLVSVSYILHWRVFLFTVTLRSDLTPSPFELYSSVVIIQHTLLFILCVDSTFNSHSQVLCFFPGNNNRIISIIVLKCADCQKEIGGLKTSIQNASSNAIHQTHNALFDMWLCLYNGPCANVVPSSSHCTTDMVCVLPSLCSTYVNFMHVLRFNFGFEHHNRPRQAMDAIDGNDW